MTSDALYAEKGGDIEGYECPGLHDRAKKLLLDAAWLTQRVQNAKRVKGDLVDDACFCLPLATVVSLYDSKATLLLADGGDEDQRRHGSAWVDLNGNDRRHSACHSCCDRCSGRHSKKGHSRASPQHSDSQSPPALITCQSQLHAGGGRTARLVFRLKRKRSAASSTGLIAPRYAIELHLLGPHSVSDNVIATLSEPKKCRSPHEMCGRTELGLSGVAVDSGEKNA